MSINHQHLRAFHAVAAEGSFSRAARRLNISQPTLSQQIKSLEARYGQMLLERRRSPLQLTPIGIELHAMTCRIFTAADEAEELLRRDVAGVGSSIRLVADSPSYAVRLAQVLFQIGVHAVPEIQIANSQETLARLIDARADVAIVSDPQIDSRLAYEPLFVDELRVVMPIGHHLSASSCFPVAALSGECVLLRESKSKTRAATEALLDSAGITPKQVICIHSREAIREAIAIGMGMSLMFSSECPPDTRLAYARPDQQPTNSLLTGYLVCKAEYRRSVAMRAVYEAAAGLHQDASTGVSGVKPPRLMVEPSR